MKIREVKSKFMLLFTILLTCGFTSCIDDTVSDKETYDNVKNGKGSLTVYVPSSLYSTRDGSVPPSDLEKENNILNLYLFNEEGSFYKKVTLKNGDSEKDKTADGGYKLDNIEAGDYYIALTSNIESYLSLSGDNEGNLDNISKSDLEKILLEFDSSKCIEPGNLPKVWFSDEVDGDGLINIGKNTEIHASLGYLCAKLRLTILIEDPDIASGTENVNVSVKNIALRSKLRGQTTDSDLNNETSTWELELNKYEYPEDYPAQEGAHLEDFDKRYESGDKCAFQGIIYIPENIPTKPTTLTFPRIGGKESQSTDVLGNKEGEYTKVERGNMYDLTVTIEPSPLTYRIYWPAECGRGLYITNFEGADQNGEITLDTSKEIGEPWPKSGEPISYYCEFTSMQTSGLFTCQFTNIKGSNSLPIELNIEDCFSPYQIGGKTIYIGYLNAENQQPSNMYPGFPYVIKKNDYLDIFWEKPFNDIEDPYLSIWIGESWIKEDFEYQGDNGKGYFFGIKEVDDTKYDGYLGRQVRYLGIEDFLYFKYKLASKEGNNITPTYSISVFDAEEIRPSKYQNWITWIFKLESKEKSCEGQ